MRYIFFSALLILSCGNKTANDKIENKKSNKQNQIILIFEKNDAQTNSEKKVEILTNSDIKYSEYGSYLERFLFPKNKNKKDTLTININSESILLTHVFDKNKVYLYQLKKGDTAVFNYSKGIPILSIKNRQVKKFDLNFESEFSSKKPLEDFDFFVFNKRNRNEKEKEQYKEDLLKYRIKSKKSLDSLVDINQLSNEISNIQYNRIKYYETNINKNFSNINTKDLTNDSLIYLKTYRFFLRNYALNNLNITKKSVQKESTYDNGTAFDEVYKSNIFSKKTKEYLLYNFLRTLGDEGSDISNKFKQFEGIAEDSLAIDEIRNNYLTDLSKFKKEISKTNFITINKDIDNLDQIITENKNKVIYIDFWASWCAPCRASMGASKELRNQYKNKDIVFIYISIDSDFNKWESAVKKESLYDYKNSFLAINYPNSIFYKQLQLNSIPRYVIYNKKSVLVNGNAPKPDSKEIITELDKYLNQ